MRWRINNQSPVNLIVGSFGMDSNMQARVTVPAGQSREYRDGHGHLCRLDEGARMFVAWDDFTDEVKGYSVFPVQRSLGNAITLQIFNEFGMDVSYS